MSVQKISRRSRLCRSDKSWNIGCAVMVSSVTMSKAGWSLIWVTYFTMLPQSLDRIPKDLPVGIWVMHHIPLYRLRVPFWISSCSSVSRWIARGYSISPVIPSWNLVPCVRHVRKLIVSCLVGCFMLSPCLLLMQIMYHAGKKVQGQFLSVSLGSRYGRSLFLKVSSVSSVHTYTICLEPSFGTCTVHPLSGST